MGAPLGNKYWMQRSDMTKDGRKLSVKQVETKLKEYIQRCINDRLYEVDFVGQRAVEVKKPKMICMSIWGACAYLGITDVTWLEWKKDKKYSSILRNAEIIFKSWNLEGATAGFLKENIISRLEGLKDSQDITSAGNELKGLTIKWGDNELDV